MKDFGLERGRSKEETRANHQSLAKWHEQEEGRLLAGIAKIEREKQIIEDMASKILEDDSSQNILEYKSIGDALFETL